jgi:hypothetical protein
MDSEFVGLLIQIPFTISHPDPPTGISSVTILLTTTEVEIFSGLVHNVYFDWEPGMPFPAPVGSIDDAIIFEGKPEIHQVNIPAAFFGGTILGKHTLTVQVNPGASAGLRDDFVLKRIEISENVGARIGW